MDDAHALDDPLFGPLTWDGPFGVYGKFEYKRGCSALLYVTCGDEGLLPQALLLAHAAFGRFLAAERAIRLRSVAEFEKARDADDVWSHQDIANLLRIAELVFRPDGGMEVYWDDDYVLFACSYLVTELGPAGEFLSAYTG